MAGRIINPRWRFRLVMCKRSKNSKKRKRGKSRSRSKGRVRRVGCRAKGRPKYNSLASLQDYQKPLLSEFVQLISTRLNKGSPRARSHPTSASAIPSSPRRSPSPNSAGTPGSPLSTLIATTTQVTSKS